MSLFFILGVFSFSASCTTFGVKSIKRKLLSVSAALVVACGYGFFDEWHKQFIGGRHFQVDEAMLNMLSGAIGMVVTIVVMIGFKKIKKIADKSTQKT